MRESNLLSTNNNLRISVQMLKVTGIRPHVTSLEVILADQPTN